MFWMFRRNLSNSNVAAQGYPAESARRSPHFPERRKSLVNDSDLSAAFSAYGSDIFCIINSEFDFLFLSDNWKSISGLNIEESMGAGFKERVLPKHIPKITAYLEKADTNTQAVRFQVEYDTGWHWFELRLAMTGQEKDSGITTYTCLMRNVDELVNTQTDHDKYRFEADIAKKSRSEFLANMNHELRTPLNAIIGFAQMIETGVYGELGHPKYTDYVSNIQNSGLTLLSKVNDLMDIASIDSGQMMLDEKLQDLTPIIRQAADLQSQRALNKKVELRINLPVKALMAVVDRVRMLQVLNNIISNAIKYNNADGTVDIYCERRKDSGINIVIEDNGTGFNLDHLDRINLAFRQENSFFARTRNCVGIGLALSKEIVKLHNGKIEIESQPGKGTLLKIVLPPETTSKAVKQKADALDLID